MEQYTGIILPHLEEFRQQQHQPQQPEADWVIPEIPGPSAVWSKSCMRGDYA
ncbi:hypothetical protein ACAG13_20595 [Escherichia coli]|jgi:hypothetical protein|uniref:hypothetical protein n=1 Tax=Escherichia coli TaxID=562 RepID=UPI0022E2A70A|nr:hypothetical protein [Escherichia coli]